MDLSNIKIFSKEGKDYTFEDLAREIYDSSVSRKEEISGLIKEAKNALKNPNAHSYIGPVISSYLDSSIKNDDQLTKLATVIQRMTKESSSNSGGDDGIFLTEEEKLKLFQEASLELKKEK